MAVIGNSDTKRMPEVQLILGLPENEVERLEMEAQRLGVKPALLARMFLLDAMARPREDFERAAEKVLRKREGLLRKLA